MGVQYTQFNEVNMNDIDAVVVGSGFAGGVVARELAERAGKRGTRMSSHGAVCLETQVFPDGMNHYAFPSPVLHPGEHLHTETVYAFSVR